jgi:hypothetical protein
MLDEAVKVRADLRDRGPGALHDAEDGLDNGVAIATSTARKRPCLSPYR